MKKLSLMPDDRAVRTQITLTKGLKKEIELRAARNGQSLAAYLRQAALLQIAEEKRRDKDRGDAADGLIGALKLEDHPEWDTDARAYGWVRTEREGWEK